jgi:hypothetical protein
VLFRSFPHVDTPQPSLGRSLPRRDAGRLCCGRKSYPFAGGKVALWRTSFTDESDVHRGGRRCLTRHRKHLDRSGNGYQTALRGTVCRDGCGIADIGANAEINRLTRAARRLVISYTKLTARRTRGNRYLLAGRCDISLVRQTHRLKCSFTRH